MAKPKIRRANSEDFDQVWSMFIAARKELCKPEPNKKDLIAIRKDIKCFYVADLEGVLLSQRMVIHDYPIRYRDKDGDQTISGSFMGNAYTLPDYRGQGLSTRIFEAIERDARDLGIKALYVAAEGPGMLEWWQHRGVVVIGECKACSRADSDCSNIPLLVKYLT